jgi:hypothetical protein
VEGANAEEILGYDDNNNEGEDDGNNEEASTSDDEAAPTMFKQTTRVRAVRHAEGNRCIGIRMQNAVVKDFNVSTFISYSPSPHEILDAGMENYGAQAGQDKGPDHRRTRDPSLH